MGTDTWVFRTVEIEPGVHHIVGADIRVHGIIDRSKSIRCYRRRDWGIQIGVQDLRLRHSFTGWVMVCRSRDPTECRNRDCVRSRVTVVHLGIDWVWFRWNLA